MKDEIKSGKTMLNDFFANIQNIEGIDIDIAKTLARLFYDGKLTDVQMRNELQKLRDKNVNKN